ncbi:MAG: hypothetical protein P8L68_03695 [Paracoccaceae bacterium]|nr:hypothetical protein [Paracoccaceae bacterium]MDG2257580.1 hypothetical protein [Paracoccaceae bacterium]
MLQKIAAFCFFLLGCSGAQAQGVLDGSDDLLVRDITKKGTAMYKVLGVRFYQASLYSTEDSFSWQYPLALELGYMRSFSGEMLVSATLHEVVRMGVPDEDHSELHPILGECFKSVQKGDVYLAIADNPNRLRFKLNSEQVCEIDYENIAPKVLGIWLSDASRDLKRSRQLRGLK